MMNPSRPAWYEQAKSGPFGRPVFTPEMKLEVSRRIEQKLPHRRKNTAGWAAAVITICCFIALFIAARLNERMGTHAGDPVEAIKLEYRYAVKTPADLSDEGTKRATMRRISKSSVIVHDQVAFQGIGKFFTYTWTAGNPQPYFGIEITDGPGAAPGFIQEFGPGLLKDVELAKSNAFGQPGIRLSGQSGATMRYTDWLVFEDGKWVRYFHLDARVDETDLDGDGVTDVVANLNPAYGRIYIYKKIGDRIEFASLDERLQSTPTDSIVYDPDRHIFQVSSGNQIRSYRYAAGEDQLVRIANQQ